MSKKYEGRCLCKGVQFSVVGDALLVCNCFCADCRRVSGSAGASIAIFPAVGFSLDKGEAVSHMSKAASGKSLTRNFCPTCGSRLFTSNVGAFPGTVMIALGALVEGHGLSPTINIFGKDRQAWSFGTDELPTMEAMPS